MKNERVQDRHSEVVPKLGICLVKMVFTTVEKRDRFSGVTVVLVSSDGAEEYLTALDPTVGIGGPVERGSQVTPVVAELFPHPHVSRHRPAPNGG